MCHSLRCRHLHNCSALSVHAIDLALLLPQLEARESRQPAATYSHISTLLIPHSTPVNMAFSRFAASTSKRASSSLVKSTSSRLYSSSAATSSSSAVACPACNSSTSSSSLLSSARSLRTSSSPSSSLLLSRRNYATPSRPNSMAEVVDSPERTAPGQGAKISVDEIKPYNPDPVVVSPINDEGVDAAVKSIREDIGRPIYLDVQVCPHSKRLQQSLLL